jgi:hypothetical protein
MTPMFEIVLLCLVADGLLERLLGRKAREVVGGTRKVP